MSAVSVCGVGCGGRRIVRDVIGGVTRSKLADRVDPDEDFIKSSDDEPAALATIGIDH